MGSFGGKSSYISAFLGEMENPNGNFKVRVSNGAWGWKLSAFLGEMAMAMLM